MFREGQTIREISTGKDWEVIDIGYADRLYSMEQIHLYQRSSHKTLSWDHAHRGFELIK